MGGLVSVFCFRKVATAILDKVFNTVPNEASSSAENTLFSLPRSHANELSLAAALGSNLLAQVSNLVFASDASKEKGAFCSCQLPHEGPGLVVCGRLQRSSLFLATVTKNFFEGGCMSKTQTGLTGQRRPHMFGTRSTSLMRSQSVLWPSAMSS